MKLATLAHLKQYKEYLNLKKIQSECGIPNLAFKLNQPELKENLTVAQATKLTAILQALADVPDTEETTNFSAQKQA